MAVCSTHTANVLCRNTGCVYVPEYFSWLLRAREIIFRYEFRDVLHVVKYVVRNFERNNNKVRVVETESDYVI